MNLTIRYVEPDHAAETWPFVEEFIASAIPYGNDDYTLDQAKMFVCLGQWLLLVAVDEENKLHGAATIIFTNYPNSRIAFITFIGGKLISNQDTFKQMVAILKQRGATKIQGAARPAIARLWKRYGFEEVTTIVGTDI